MEGVLKNYTTHDICFHLEGNNLVKVIPAERTPMRLLEEQKTCNLSFAGIPLVYPVDYIGLDGIPNDTNCNVIVSSKVAKYIRIHHPNLFPTVFVPEGAENGETKRLVVYCMRYSPPLQ